MNNAQVLAKLFRLTGSLAPVSPASPADLHELRRRMAHSYFDAPGDGVSSFVPSDEASQGTISELKAIVAEAALERSTPDAKPPPTLVLRRDLPLFSTNQAQRFPARSGAQRVQRVFGPMLEHRERFVFFDLFEAADLLRVVRQAGTPFLLLPADAASADGLRFRFGAGSVWIEARLLAASALGYCGLRVSAGTLEFREAANRIGDNIVATSGTDCVLTLKLQEPTIPPPAGGPGQDAGSASAVRPGEATFEFSPTRTERIVTTEGSLAVYGAAIQMTRTDAPAVADEPITGVLIPFEPDTTELTPSDVRSTLLQVAGDWTISGAGWLLPTSVVTDAERLGEAADCGAMAIVVERGLRATWAGLTAGPYVAERALLAADSRELCIVANGRTKRIACHDVALWRDSSLEVLFEDRFQLQYVSSRDGAEALVARATVAAHIDRPRQADGNRARIQMKRALVSLSQQGAADWLHVSARRRTEPGKTVPLGLANALLKATPAEELTVAGVLTGSARDQLAGAALRVTFGVDAIIPILPDPYAANFDPLRRANDEQVAARLTAVISWSGPESPEMRLLLAAAGDDPERLARLLPAGQAAVDGSPDENVLKLLFARTLGLDPDRVQPRLMLLDLSTNADHLGVGTSFTERRLSGPQLAVQGMFLSASVHDLRLMALPQVSWEPVRTHPPDLQPGFPQPLVSRDDGGPFMMGVATETVHLTPIAPYTLVRDMVHLAAQPKAATAIRFTLPFGIKAVAAIQASRGVPSDVAAVVALNQPHFGELTAGMQVILAATSNFGVPGGAIQTRNSASATPQSVLGDIVDGFFNLAFHPSDTIRRIPVSRIDFSGYGASAFSKWVNENAAAVDITRVEFDILTGRTGYEVVEIQSILWPCMARVVRRITIRREGGGWVLRRDSGWVAATPGLFFRSDCACVVHPGVLKGMYNIREIRDTPQRVRVNPNVELQAVYFDTDLAFEGVERGHAFDGIGPHGERARFVPSHRQLGFVQLINLDSPQQTPLTPAQLAELLQKNAPVGGPLDCELDIGGSGQRMRAGSIYAGVAPQPGAGAPHFAVGTYGAPELPREAQWSVVRLRNSPPDSPEPEALDQRVGVPLVRVGAAALAPAANPNAYRFADPVDLLRPTQPEFDYALLMATQTFRVLFPRVKLEPGSRTITSTLAPVLADAYAMISATGVFPRLKHAIEFPSSAYELRILGPGRLRLSPSLLTQTVPPRVLEMVKTAGVHAFTEYRGGDRFQQGPARVTFRFDSTATPSWEMKMGPVSNVTEIEPFGPLMRLISTLEADSVARPRCTSPIIEYGGALRPLEELITFMKEFGIPVDMQVETPNSTEPEHSHKLKVKLDVIDFELHVPGKIKGEMSLSFEVGTTKTSKDFLMPGGSVEIAVEIEGKLQLPIIKPALYGGGLFRLYFITGYDPSEKEAVKREIKLSAAAVGSVGGKLIPHVLKVEGEVRYGYVFVADFAKKEYHPGVLVGFALECEIAVKRVELFKIGFEAEVIGLVKRIDDDDIHLRAEATMAGEVELFDMLSFEYTYEIEWDQKLPSKVIAALAVAAHFNMLPLPIPP